MRSSRCPSSSAARFGFALNAVQNWEQGRREPDGAARAYLTVIDRSPIAVRRALSERKMVGKPAPVRLERS
jgi:putative transcriptional regulator